MLDEVLDWVADLFINHEISKKHGWTFEEFLKAFERNEHGVLLERSIYHGPTNTERFYPVG